MRIQVNKHRAARPSKDDADRWVIEVKRGTGNDARWVYSAYLNTETTVDYSDNETVVTVVDKYSHPLSWCVDKIREEVSSLPQNGLIDLTKIRVRQIMPPYRVIPGTKIVR